MRDRPFLAYLAALGLGLVLAWQLLPAEFVWPRAGEAWRPVGDAAQHAIAQRHFLAAPWAWPPLGVPTLLGVNLAFLDGIPLMALALKAVRGWLPEGFHGIGLFYALAWVLQPVAAVWALRGFGVRGWVPALSVAVLAASMPAFVNRYGHAALCGHFVVLLALGLYARALRGDGGGGRWWLVAVPFQVAALLVHPYLALMALAVLGAVPLSALLRGRPWVGHAAGLLAAAGAMGLAMWLLGYLGAAGDGGYGAYALNLLSPLWPHGSLFFGWAAPRAIHAPGVGGWEGYNWLGLGLWLALLAAALLAWRDALAALRRHAGLALACLGLVALAVSWRVGFGWGVLFDLGEPPSFLEQFRASGRFFWPVGYALLLAAAALLARAGRAGRAALALCAALQFADAAPLREDLARWAGERAAWTVEADALRPALRAASRHVFLPSWPCIPPEGHRARERLLELLLLASESPRAVNTMYVARWRGAPPACRDAPTLARPPEAGELRLLLPDAPPSAGACELAGELRVCR